MGRRLKNAPVVNRVQMNLNVSKSLKSDLEAIAIANGKTLIDVAIDALSIYVKKRNKGAIANG